MILAGLLLQACGGGSGTSSDTASDNPGGVASYSPSDTQHLGTVSGLGSVVVNGVRFETLSATVQDSDDVYGSTSKHKTLALGMTLAIDGEADDEQRVGRARKIRHIGGVRGTVSAYSASQSVTVGGQTVVLNSNTLFADTTASTLQVGAFVNIDGLMQSDKRFLATRIHVSSPDEFAWDAAWRGQSSGATTDASGSQFTLDTGPGQSFSVQCPDSTCRIEPSGANLTNTHAVRVLAASDASRSGNSIVASRVQVLDAAHLLQWDGSTTGRVKIKGVATLDGTQWSIGGTPVTGSTLPWEAGRFYEVKGVLSNGTLTVTSWELEDDPSHDTPGGEPKPYRHELYGAISALAGTRMVVQGITVDVAQAYFEHGSLSDLRNGLYVEVKGSLQDGVLMASKIEFKSDGLEQTGRFEVQGIVSNWSSTGFTLTAGNTTYNALINAQTRIDREHGEPGNGRRVEAKGYMRGADFVVTKLEVED